MATGAPVARVASSISRALYDDYDCMYYKVCVPCNSHQAPHSIDVYIAPPQRRHAFDAFAQMAYL